MNEQQIKNLVRSAYEFVYLPYRVCDYLIGGSYDIASDKVASASCSRVSDAKIWNALDFAYSLGLIRTGRHPRSYTKQYLLWMLDVHHPVGGFYTYLLDKDNHDGVWFRTQEGRCYILNHDDSNYWLRKAYELDVDDFNMTYNRRTSDRLWLVSLAEERWLAAS